MSADDLTHEATAVYGTAAPIYWEAGWRGILPVPARRKGNPPVGYTGNDGIFPSYADITAWAETRPCSNIVLRLPDGIIGIDVDAHGEKTGAAALIEAELRWGALPDTWRSTSRLDDPISGVYLFRVPKGLLFTGEIKFPELGIGNVDIVQRHHRYVTVWPSIHPKGRLYRWIRPDGTTADTVPTPDDLGWLP